LAASKLMIPKNVIISLFPLLRSKSSPMTLMALPSSYLSYPEDGGKKFLRNIGTYTASTEKFISSGGNASEFYS
jgi:hypothetical protein